MSMGMLRPGYSLYMPSRSMITHLVVSEQGILVSQNFRSYPVLFLVVGKN